MSRRIERMMRTKVWELCYMNRIEVSVEDVRLGDIVVTFGHGIDEDLVVAWDDEDEIITFFGVESGNEYNVMTFGGCTRSMDGDLSEQITLLANDGDFAIYRFEEEN